MRALFSDKSRLSLASVTILACVGFLTVMLLTSGGIDISPDSVTYIRGTHALLEGRGFSTISDTGDNVPITHFPPLYSFVLAALSSAGLGTLEAARWFNAAVFCLTIWLVGFSIQRKLPRSPLAPALGSFLILTSTTILTTATIALTELIFILLLLLSLLCLTGYLERGRLLFLICAALATAAALLTRYAALPLIPTAIGAIILFSPSTQRKKLFASALFSVIAIIPFAVWLMRNFIVAGSSTNRQFVVHPITGSRLLQGALTLSSWVLPEALPRGVRLVVFFVLSGSALAIVVWLLLERRITVRSIDIGILPHLLIMFVVTYLVFLITSISFMDAHTPLDNRILSPVYVAAVITILTFIAANVSHFSKLIGRQIATTLLIGAGILFAMFTSVQAINWSLHVYATGQGYTAKAWQESETIRAVRQLPPETHIFTNAPDAVYILTNRVVSRIPSQVSAGTRLENPDYHEQLNQMKKVLQNEKAVLVYFDLVTWRWYQPSKEELQHELELQTVVQTNDGIIYSHEGS